MADIFKVKVGADGQLEKESLRQAVSERVIVQTIIE